jgi:hypothetical protein
MVVESATTTALKLRPKRSMTIKHDDGSESKVTEEFDGEDSDDLPLPPSPIK